MFKIIFILFEGNPIVHVVHTILFQFSLSKMYIKLNYIMYIIRMHVRKTLSHNNV